MKNFKLFFMAEYMSNVILNVENPVCYIAVKEINNYEDEHNHKYASLNIYGNLL